MLRFKKDPITLVLLMLFSLLSSMGTAQAMTTLKQVQVSNGAVIDLLFDGKIDKSQIHTEYLNDVIQISLTDVGVYPAKISSVNGGNLIKIFAYQYAPKLVRCRLTVKGKAEDYKDRLQLGVQGKMINIRLSDSPIKQDQITTQSAHAERVASAAPQKGRDEKSEEKPTEKKIEIPTIPVESLQALKSEESLLAHVSGTTTSKPIAIANNHESISERRSERKTDHLQLSGAKPLPSMMSVVTKLFAVIAFFGVIAFLVKKFSLGSGSLNATKRSLNARVVRGENNWLSVLGGMARNATQGLGRKDKMIEVLSNHHLGPKKSIAVVRVMGRTMVLGVTNESINLISQISGPLSQTGLTAASTQTGSSESSDDEFDSDFAEDGLDIDLERILGVKPAPNVKSAAPQLSRKTAPAGAVTAQASNANSGFSNILSSESQKPASNNVRSQIRSRLEGLKQL